MVEFIARLKKSGRLRVGKVVLVCVRMYLGRGDARLLFWEWWMVDGRISSGVTIALGDLIDQIRAWEDLLSTCAMAAFVLGKEGQSRLVGGWVVGRPCPDGSVEL